MGSIGTPESKMYKSSAEFKMAINSKYALEPSVRKGQYTISEKGEGGRQLATIRFDRDLGYSIVSVLGKDNTGRDTWMSSNTLEGLELQLRRR